MRQGIRVARVRERGEVRLGLGPAQEVGRPSWVGRPLAFSLPSLLFNNKELEERKGEKRRLEEEFGSAVNFPRLIKM